MKYLNQVIRNYGVATSMCITFGKTSDITKDKTLLLRVNVNKNKVLINFSNV